MIKKVKKGYKVLSGKGKSLGGPYKTKTEAEKRCVKWTSLNRAKIDFVVGKD